jgi:hypothetical protein
MAKKRRGRWVEVEGLRVRSKGKNLELMFRIPAEVVSEVLPHIKRFLGRTKGPKRSKEGSTYTKT